MEEKFLPIGTVVLLKNGTKRLMITGFCAVAKEKEGEVFDYVGCLYPEGVIDSSKTALFNHDQIQKIYSLGYSDEEEKDFKSKLNEYINKKQDNNVDIID